MTSRSTCTQPGCGGTVEDGFCLSCGMESALSPAPAHPVISSNPATSTIPRGTSLSSTMRGTAVTGPGSVASRTSTSTSTSGTSRGSSRSGTRGTRGSGRTSSRRQLGLGLVQIPELPTLDPTTVIMANPSVPEAKRYCPQCEQKLTREKGFCPQCGKAYSFLPTLQAGDVVAAQYEVLGAMTFGGLGWIYLAKDKALSRWVVLKGLLNAKDTSSAAVAVAERQFLAAVKHPNIVSVYTFVERESEGYIVMEFVRGKSLKEIRKERGPLPVTEAIAYIHRILAAFAYLHRQEPPLIYCDFKPENVMLEGDDVKLIDLGAVRREDDPGGEVYGTKGYSAPEGGEHPSIASDLFTVARTLAVLITDFKSFQSRYRFTLPPPGEQPLFTQYDSLYRFLLKCTHENPVLRFQSADEMAEQLAGILREIVAVETGVARPAESSLFGGDPLGFSDVGAPAPLETPRMLPPLKLDPTDPAASFLVMNSGAYDPIRIYTEAIRLFPESVDARLRLIRSYIEGNLPRQALDALHEWTEINGEDWQTHWLRGLSFLSRGMPDNAVVEFEQVYNSVPGELAPRVALAFSLEGMGDYSRAAVLYNLVAKTDPSFISAIFGLARCYANLKQLDLAAEAYSRVPTSSQYFVRAQIALARIWMRSTTQDQIARAAQAIEALGLDGQERHRLVAEVLNRALSITSDLASRPHTFSNLRLFGRPMVETEIKSSLEDTLRSLARLTKNDRERNYLIDLANDVRPFTWM